MSETLRRFSETCMHSLARSVFSRLHGLDPALEEEKLRVNEDDGEDGDIRMTVLTTDGPSPPATPISTPEMNRDSASDSATIAVAATTQEAAAPDAHRPECQWFPLELVS